VAADIERAATAKGRAGLGCYSIEGLRLHERALRAGLRVERVLVGAGLRVDRSTRVQSLLAALDESGCSIQFAPDEALTELTGGRDLGALLGLVRIPRPPELPAVLSAAPGERTLLLVAVDVDEPGNVGALVRTALASGARAFLGIGRGDPYHPKAVRTSMGSLFRLPVLRIESADPLLEELRSAGVRCVGAVSEGGTSLPQANLDHPRVALFVGSEAFGLEPELIEQLDDRVTIPMGSTIDSYSVNAAAAILLYALRQAG
jgi:TrmH family RNA methyltransferase